MPQMFHRLIAQWTVVEEFTKFGKQAEQKICCDFRKTQRTKTAARVFIVRDNTLVLRTARPAFEQITRLYQTGR